MEGDRPVNGQSDMQRQSLRGPVAICNLTGGGSSPEASIRRLRRDGSDNSVQNLSLNLSGFEPEELIHRAAELVRENEELRALIVRNTAAMDNQCQVLLKWQETRAREREALRQKHLLTKNLVANLQADIRRLQGENLSGDPTECRTLEPVTTTFGGTLTSQQEVAMTEVLSQLRESQNKQSDVRKELLEKDRMIDELRAELESRDAELQDSRSSMAQQLHEKNSLLLQQLDEFNAQLQLFQSKSDQNTDVHNLKAQVISLIGEVQERNKTNSKLKDRCSLAEVRVSSLSAELTDLRNKDDKVIDQLNATVVEMEKRIDELDRENSELKNALTRVSELHKSAIKQCQAQKDACRDLGERTDLLTAEKASMEEAVRGLRGQVEELEKRAAGSGDEATKVRALEVDVRDLRVELESSEQEKVLLRIQMDTYMSDFEAEREARRRQHEDSERLKEDFQELSNRNYDLNKEVREMHRKMQLLQQQLLLHRPERDQLNANHYGKQESMAHSSPQAENSYVCPCCGTQTTDIDSLQIHVMDCIK